MFLGGYISLAILLSTYAFTALAAPDIRLTLVKKRVDKQQDVIEDKFICPPLSRIACCFQPDKIQRHRFTHIQAEGISPGDIVIGMRQPNDKKNPCSGRVAFTGTGSPPEDSDTMWDVQEFASTGRLSNFHSKITASRYDERLHRYHVVTGGMVVNPCTAFRDLNTPEFAHLLEGVIESVEEVAMLTDRVAMEVAKAGPFCPNRVNASVQKRRARLESRDLQKWEAGAEGPLGVYPEALEINGTVYSDGGRGDQVYRDEKENQLDLDALAREYDEETRLVGYEEA
ncbi:MAG: hypothetical protein M1833_005218 [Piccolia ochrophora]|nr:MAG: hypothetical protein M1833_005218 [Piccolia ochrophora]